MALETPLALHHTHINLRVVIIGRLFPPEIPDIRVSFFFAQLQSSRFPCYFFQVREV